MKWINHYLRCVYVDGGRGPVSFDCWGLVRHVRHFELGFNLLPSFGDLRNDNPKAFTKAYREESHRMKPCVAEHGSIAAVMIGAICVHVALVIEDRNRFMILEINPGKGPRFIPLADWQKDHVLVTFHKDNVQ